MKRLTPILIPPSLAFLLSVGWAPNALFGMPAALKETDR